MFEAALFYKFRSFLRYIVWGTLSPAVCIDAYMWPDRSAYEIVYRLFDSFSNNVPHCYFYPAQRAVLIHCRPFGGEIFMGDVHKMPYVERVTVD